MSDFLYPFLSGDSTGTEGLLDDLASSARAKVAQSESIRSASLTSMGPVLDAAASHLAERFSSGGRMHVFGNGGSSTDASSLVSLFSRPPCGVGLPARTLTDDPAVLTALGNDIGYDRVFSRQLIALARPVDIAVGLSTSGSSRNLIHAFREARSRGLATVGFAGYDGGDMASCDAIDHLLVVDSDSVHRIQEAQAALGQVLWERIVSRLEHTRA